LKGFFVNGEGVIKGLVIAGTKSGSGKTTVTLGLLAALAKRGLSVAPFKVGPDFIDPGHHTRITGRVSRNLDGWMLSKTRNIECFRRYTTHADIAVVEGVMGLFDGYSGKSEAGSTAQIAKWLDLPVLLVVDAKSMARSAAAVVQGFENFDGDLSFAGVLFNHIASSRHFAYLTEAMENHTRTPCLGGVQQNDEIAIPERHLGLVTREDYRITEDNKNRLADIIEKSTDLDAFLKGLPDMEIAAPIAETPTVANRSRIKLGVAMDNAFCFYYQDNLDLLENHGAEIVRFSPTTDSRLPEDLDGLYFGGGYPELHARRLSENRSMRDQIRNQKENGMPVYSECGGFMYLCRELTDMAGNRFPMVGCFPFSARMFPRLKALGYREVTFSEDTLLGKRGQTLRGHEFHYSELDHTEHDMDTVYTVTARDGGAGANDGYQTARCLGSYIHLHFGSRPEAARCFVDICNRYRQER